MPVFLPVISGWAVMAENGALCTYGPRLVSLLKTGHRSTLSARPPAVVLHWQPARLEKLISLGLPICRIPNIEANRRATSRGLTVF
jgi:hypothetical protein